MTGGLGRCWPGMPAGYDYDGIGEVLKGGKEIQDSGFKIQDENKDKEIQDVPWIQDSR